MPSVMQLSNSVAAVTRSARSWICQSGLVNFARIGTLLDGETPLAIIHAASDDDADMAAKLLLDACITQEDAPVVGPVIHEKLTGDIMIFAVC